MAVDSGLAPREGTPGGHVAGTCYACPAFPGGHPFVGDLDTHLREVGERSPVEAMTCGDEAA